MSRDCPISVIAVRGRSLPSPPRLDWAWRFVGRAATNLPQGLRFPAEVRPSAAGRSVGSGWIRPAPSALFKKTIAPLGAEGPNRSRGSRHCPLRYRARPPSPPLRCCPAGVAGRSASALGSCSASTITEAGVATLFSSTTPCPSTSVMEASIGANKMIPVVPSMASVPPPCVAISTTRPTVI